MASRGVNKVILMGNLGADPEVRYTNDGRAIANITIATSESWKDKATNEKREKTEWHRVCLYGKTAEIAGEYLRKGSQVYIEGMLETKKWQDQNGQDRYTTQVAVKPFHGTMQMIGSAQQRGQQQGVQGQSQQRQAAPQQQQAAKPHPQQEPPMDFDDDIPF